MKVPVIKKLVENFSAEQLEEAEEALYAEEKMAIEVEGDDDGEKLTHLIAAQWVKNRLKDDDTIELRSALREYTQKVRNSIS